MCESELKLCPGEAVPGPHYSSPALAQQGQGSTLPNPALEWTNDQKSHLGGGPTKAQGFLRLSICAACLDPPFLLEFVSEHCWNPGIGSYLCFSISSVLSSFFSFPLLGTF